jgi:hypothetical protein
MPRGEADLRRLVSGGAVLLLHLGLVTVFLFANYARTLTGNQTEEIELRLPPPPPRQTVPIPPALEPQLIAPETPLLPVFPGQLFAPKFLPAPPSPEVLSGVGRALFGCDPQKLDTLSAKDRAACLRVPSRAPPPHNVRLGLAPDPNSPFTKEIEERFRQAVPINRPCPLGSFNDTHGLPCFGFQGEEASPIYPLH